MQGQLSGAVWLAIGFALLAGVAPLAGIWLLIQPAALSWAFAGVVCLSAAAGYILTRSIAVPGDPGDRGNWLEPLGLAALMIEWIVVILTGLALSRRPPGARIASVNLAAAARELASEKGNQPLSKAAGTYIHGRRLAHSGNTGEQLLFVVGR